MPEIETHGLARASTVVVAAEVGGVPVMILHHHTVHVRLTPTNVSRILPTLRATKDGDPDFGPVRWVELLLGISRAIVAPGEVIRRLQVPAIAEEERGVAMREKGLRGRIGALRHQPRARPGIRVPVLGKQDGDELICDTHCFTFDH